MTQTFSLTPLADPDLGLSDVFRGSPLNLTAPVLSGYSSYRSRVWDKPQDIHLTAPAYLVEVSGTVGGSTVTFHYSGEQMNLPLDLDYQTHKSYFFNFLAVGPDGDWEVLRAGWIKLREGAFTPGDTSEDVVITVVSGNAVFTYNASIYTFPCLQVATDVGHVNGDFSLVGGDFLWWYANNQYSVPVLVVPTPLDKFDGDVWVDNDDFYVCVGTTTVTCPCAILV